MSFIRTRFAWQTSKLVTRNEPNLKLIENSKKIILNDEWLQVIRLPTASGSFLVGAFINKRARLLQSLVFFPLRQTRSDER